MISDQKLLVVILLFTLLNFGLVISYGAVIFHWHHHYMEPVLICQQPKWRSTGYTFRRFYGYYDIAEEDLLETTHQPIVPWGWSSWQTGRWSACPTLSFPLFRETQTQQNDNNQTATTDSLPIGRWSLFSQPAPTNDN